MKIAVIGAGTAGRALGRGLSAAGHDTVVAVRDPESPAACAAADAGLPVLPIAWALEGAEVVVLAVPHPAIAALATSLGGSAVIVDASNHFTIGDDGPVPAAGPTGAELVAAAVPGARVVKTFNSVGAEHLAAARFPSPGAVMPLCGTGPEERAVAAELASDLGFVPVDVGGLEAARSLEHLAALWVRHSRARQGRGFAFGIVDTAVE